MKDKQRLDHNEVQQIKAVIARLGTGFYRSELTTLLRRSERSDELRAIDELIPNMKASDLKNDIIDLIEHYNKGERGA